MKQPATQTANTAARYGIPLALNKAVDTALPGREHRQDRFRVRVAIRAIMAWERDGAIHCDQVPAPVRERLANLLEAALDEDDE